MTPLGAGSGEKRYWSFDLNCFSHQCHGQIKLMLELS